MIFQDLTSVKTQCADSFSIVLNSAHRILLEFVNQENLLSKGRYNLVFQSLLLILCLSKKYLRSEI